MKPGLAECENAVIVPHIASATLWTRAGMVRRAAVGRTLVRGCCWARNLPCALCSDAPAPPVARQATLAACNVAATLSDHPVWTKPDVLPFVDGPFDAIPKAAPSIVNAKELGLATV